MSAASRSVIAGLWVQRPASHLLFGLLAVLVTCYAIFTDRTHFIDQQNYVDSFAESATLEWLTSLFSHESILEGLVTQIFSEELLWRVWATALGSLFDPVVAVLVTVLILNLLIIATAWRLPMPSLALALWVALPVGFAVTGLLQLRQGFAFAVMLFFALQLRRPVLGALVAGMLHTTFALAFFFTLIGWLFRSRWRLALLAGLLTAFTGAYLGAMLFEIFGGRRILVYSVQEGATSINYVLGGLICILPSLHLLLTTNARADSTESRTLSNLALVHVGVTAFTIFSFFMFPMGAGRVGYLTQLLLIPILPSLRKQGIAAVLFALLVLYLFYLVGKSYVDGTYDVLL
jgi:hypothetical protein